MKSIKYLLGGILLLAGSAVHAEGGFFGVKFGPMMIDDSAVDLGISGIDTSIDDPINIGIVGGTISDSGVGFEVEFTTSASKGSINVSIPSLLSAEFDLSVQTLGAYATFRSSGDTYFKGKLGYVNGEIEIENESDDDSDVSYGIGVGFLAGVGSRVEIEYTQYTILEEDVDFLSIGFLF